MTELERIIIQRIRAEGPISFEEFMELALYHPEQGYYMTAEERIGPEGDYYTSPHLHPLFGYTIGIQIEEMWETLGRPSEFSVVEIGAGRGYLAEGILGYFEKKGLISETGYIIVERNPHQMKKQRHLLERYPVKWVSTLKELSGMVGVIISNELLDALPVHLITFSEEGFKEILVNHSGDAFFEETAPLSNELMDYVSRYRIPRLQGYRTEVNLKIGDFLRDTRQSLDEGFVFTIDYGFPFWEYYAPERTRGTLLCYHKHRTVENPYTNIGSQDITAHVNFTYLHDEGKRQGFKNLGYTPQGTFLASLGIDRVLEEKLKADPLFIQEMPKIKGLLWGMGESHKVMIQYRGNKEDLPVLKGFQLRNRIKTLSEGL